MPELPEVETVVRGLNNTVLGEKIESVKVLQPKLRIPIPDNLAKLLVGAKIKSITRRAKYILIHLNNNYTWVIHLGMSGRLTTHNKMPPLKKHDHVIISLKRTTMVYNDTRRFGLMIIIKDQSINDYSSFKNLGLEPLEKSFTGRKLYDLIHKSNSDIKSVLMNQNIVVGVGNIYASESLFSAHISPLRKASKISLKECGLLVNSIKSVLNEAIKSGGSTLRDYVSSSGDKGYFQHKFKVYDKKGKPCPKCKSPIKRITQKGRSTYYCQNCQG